MKILHIHPSMAGGGIEAMICGLVNEMAKVHDVTLCTIFEPKKDEYASTFPHCSMKSSEYLWPKTKRLVKDERRSKSKLRVCA